MSLTQQSDPIALFREWFMAAKESDLTLHESMSLSTSTSAGFPSSRMVLLKDFDSRGFIFFTNYNSRKAQEIQENPKVSLLFHWPTLERQIRIEGSVTRTSIEESECYFRTRDRGSQVGAWASKQSATIGQESIADKVKEIENRFENQKIPLPSFWGGYRVSPNRIEFWQGRPDRLHERLLFDREAKGDWSTTLLYP
ncbi:MAG TPA: pyridoxamine 5'-phosphate oxidase [Gemmatimonadetes bacterium]|jgi:pyridoxamine 5'-phosphate oxidase|nr:pyridoxamine 5'-phosphate oxidase [Gemmatimonadota bacterium]